MEKKIKGILPVPAHLTQHAQGLVNLNPALVAKPLIDGAHSTITPEESGEQNTSEPD